MALSDSAGVEVNVIKVEEKKITQVAKFTTIPTKNIASNKEIIGQCWVKPSPSKDFANNLITLKY